MEGFAIFAWIQFAFDLSVAIAALAALVALGLAFSSRTRRAAVWVSSIVLVAGILLFLIVATSGSDPSRFSLMYAGMFAISPVYIASVALCLGLRGAAPPGKTNEIALVFLLAAGVAEIAAVGNFYWRQTGPSYQGTALSNSVKRYAYSFSMSANDQNRAEREMLVDAIRHMGAGALPFLLDWIDDDQNVPGREAPIAFGFDGPVAPAAVDALLAFGVLGPVAATAIPELTRRINLPPSAKVDEPLKDDTLPGYHKFLPSTRERNLLALCYLGPDAVPAIVAALSIPERAGLPYTPRCVENMGANARPLVPLLVNYLQHPNPNVAMSAAKALGFVMYERDLIVPALAKILDHPDINVRREALISLMFSREAFSEPGCRAALPALIKTLDNPANKQGMFGNFDAYVLRALGKLKCEPDVILPVLVKRAADPDREVRNSAVGSLTNLGEFACTAWLQLLTGGDEGLAMNAVSALGKLKCMPDLAVPALAKSLDHSSPTVRTSSAFALMTYGRLACPAAVPALIRTLDDPATRGIADFESSVVGALGAMD